MESGRVCYRWVFALRPHRPAVRTRPFQGRDRGSIPRGDANTFRAFKQRAVICIERIFWSEVLGAIRTSLGQPGRSWHDDSGEQLVESRRCRELVAVPVRSGREDDATPQNPLQDRAALRGGATEQSAPLSQS